MMRLATRLMFAGLILHAACQAQEMTPMRPSMVSAIQRIASDGKVLAVRDIDAAECGEVPSQPGLVTGNLTGNSRQDFAVLMKMGETGKEVIWEGKKLKLENLAFAIFADDGKGSFALAHVQRFEDYLPFAGFIYAEAPGTIRDRDTGNEVTMSHPSVVFVACGQSASAYHFVENRVRVIQLAD